MEGDRSGFLVSDVLPPEEPRHENFICIEGVDAVGKTTVSKALVNRLGGAYYKSPGEPFASARRLVEDSMDAQTRYFFFRSAVQYDSGVISHLLLGGIPVVCDRYVYSTFIMHYAMDPSVVSVFEGANLVLPKHVFILTADWDVVAQRLKGRSTLSSSERDTHLQKEADRLFRLQGHPVIDTSSCSVGEIVNQILSFLKE